MFINPVVVLTLSIAMNIACIVLAVVAIRWSIINNQHTKQISNHLADISTSLKAIRDVTKEEER